MITAEKTVKEQIIEIYLQLEHKGTFLFKLEKLGIAKYNTMKNWWFAESGGYSIPEKFQSIVLEEITKELVLQNDAN